MDLSVQSVRDREQGRQLLEQHPLHLPQKLCQSLLQKVDNVVWQIEQSVRLLQNLMVDDDPSYR